MAFKPYPHLLLLFFTLLTLSPLAQSRFLAKPTLSDGNNDFQHPKSFPYLSFKNNLVSGEESCEQSYGFLPCTSTAFGNLFLIIVYGFLMFTAARYLSNGSELLLEILGPGIIGGLFLPVLGALPDAMLILVSGLSGTVEVAQSQVLVGMGLLAGSTVMLLTVLWGSCVIVGKCDIEDSSAVDKRDTKGFSLTGSGVTTDIWTSYSAMFLVVSVLPFIIVQLPQIFHTSSGKRLAILIALIVSVALLLSYCIYQVFQPWIQVRKLAFAKHKHVIAGILKDLRKHSLGMLFTEDGEPDKEVIRKLFKSIDANNDGHLSRSELRALIIGIRFDELDLNSDDAVEKVLKDFDTTGDDLLDETEFIDGISRWLKHAKRCAKSGEHDKFVDDFHLQTRKEHDSLGNQNDEDEEGVENPKWTSCKAALMLLLGTAIAAAFADPLVDAVDNFSSATSIPSFFISFIALPLATNSSEAVSALIFASRKKKKMASLTFSEFQISFRGDISTLKKRDIAGHGRPRNFSIKIAVNLGIIHHFRRNFGILAFVCVSGIYCLHSQKTEISCEISALLTEILYYGTNHHGVLPAHQAFLKIYGGATMNNILCLAVFLALVYVRDLSWDFSAEVLVILIVCILMGIFGSIRTTFPLWTAIMASSLYPLSLLLVYVLDYVFGWS